MTLTGEVYTVDLSEKNHPKYKRLARMIEFETSQAFKDVPGFRQATVTNFRPGSVIATVDMKFQNTSLDQGLDEVLGATLQQYISDNGGRLGNLSVSQVEVVLPLTVDHCQPDPCVNGTCRNGADSFTCVCDDRFEGEICQTPIGM
ncbi:uncharacterized protein LOC118430219 [Branchiostoma floridae]|uniref:Uncharacterized protein LOC118430219 n=1 Tax=Branchiostoma floridae TaxID=7739 RepID=A0A9J7M8N3_BRAFL|nr:uncharacterized protein LOC118430219 [Branchiostoma floridae]